MPRKMDIPPHIEEYIRENIETISINQMERNLDLPKGKIYRAVIFLGITKRYLKGPSNPNPVYRSRPHKRKEKKPVTNRPPAVYMNKTREDYINYWINYDLKTHNAFQTTRTIQDISRGNASLRTG